MIKGDWIVPFAAILCFLAGLSIRTSFGVLSLTSSSSMSGDGGASWSDLPTLISSNNDNRERQQQQQQQSLLRSSSSSVKSSQTFEVPELYQQMYDDIEGIDTQLRCQRYGWNAFPEEESRPPRRLFFGSLLADDSPLIVSVHATESYNLYHTVSFIESNRTQTQAERTIRFPPGSEALETLTQSGIWGPETKVHVDYFHDPDPDLWDLERENTQRYLILDRWKANGMTEDDVGIIGDVDEFFSRDFLMAVKACDVPSFRPGQTCQSPKISTLTLVFEGSPECINERRRWYHPDLMVGQCIEQIGNAEGRYVAPRWYPRGTRKNDTEDDYPEQVKREGNFPLWTPADFRMVQGGLFLDIEHTRSEFLKKKIASWAAATKRHEEDYIEANGIEHTSSVAAFHLHNFFDGDDFEVLRFKYKTYGHAADNADKWILSDIVPDIDMMVRCAHGAPNKLPKKTKDWNDLEHVWMTRPDELQFYVRSGYNGTMGDMPIFFSDPAFRKSRHDEVVNMVKNDEARFGTRYKWPKNTEGKKSS